MEEGKDVNRSYKILQILCQDRLYNIVTNLKLSSVEPIVLSKTGSDSQCAFS